MNSNTSNRLTRLGIVTLLLAGMLTALFVTVAPIHGQQTSDLITVTPLTSLVTTEASGAAAFTVVLTSPPTADVTIAITSSDTTEGTVFPGILTFTTDNWSISQTVTVTGADDFVDDGDIAYQILSAPAVSSDGNFNGQDASDLSASNTDNDTAGITLNRTSGLSTSEAVTSDTFTVVLTSQPTADVTIGLSSSNTAEGTVAPPSLTFNNANWNSAQTVTVTGVNDPVADGPIAYTIITANAASGDPGYNNMIVPDVAVINTDNDTAGITLSRTSGLVTSEAGTSDTFTVVLTSQPTASVTIGLSSSNTNEGTVAPNSLTFTTGNWNVQQTVTVTGANDFVIDGSVGYTIITAQATGGDALYSTINPADVTVTNTDNDAAGITVTPTSGLVTSEGGTSATFTIALLSQPSANVTITLASSDATEGSVSPTNIVFNNGNWSTARTITVTSVDDAMVDGNIPYTITINPATSGDLSYNGLDPADVSVTNNDNDVAGITVSAISGSTTEAGVTATFTVVLTSQPASDVTIGLTSTDLTEGTVSLASLVFTNGNWNTPRTVTVTGVDDAEVDGNIGFTIVTAPATSLDANYSGRDAVNVSVTNIDNDVAGITVSATSINTSEPSGSATFTIVLTSQPTANVTIGLTSSDTTEGTVSPASLTFTNGNWNLTQSVTVTGVDDLIVDGPVGYTITTAPAVSTDVNYSGRDAANVSATNADNDVAGFTVTPTTGLTTTELGGSTSFTVVLNTQPNANVTINLTSSDTTEGTITPTSLVFTSVTWNAPQSVTVTGVNDDVADGNVGYSIVTAAASSTDPSYNGLNPPDVAVTNTDNDAAGITVTPTAGLVTNEAGGTAGFSVVLLSQPTATVTIGITSGDATEGSAAPASLVFNTGNWNTPQSVTVTGVNDDVADGNIAYSIITAAASSSDPSYSGFNPPDVAVTNNDNDTAGITVNPTTGLTTTEAGGTASFTVVLTSQPTGNVTIGLSSSTINEGTVSPASLVFTSVTWNVPQTVTVTGVNDSVVDGNVGYTIVTAQPVSSDAVYAALNSPDVAVTNTDNDVAGITVSTITGPTTEAGGTASFTVVLTSQPTATVTIGVVSNDLTEGTAAPTSLVFTTANWSTPQTVTVTGVNDDVADGNIAYLVVTAQAVSTDALYAAIDPADVAVTNTDNDAAGYTITPASGLVTTEAGGTTTFTIRLNSQPTADVVIGLSSSDTTEATVAPASVTFTSANWATNQTVTVTGVNDSIVDGTIVYTIVTAVPSTTDLTYSALNPADVSATNTDNDVAGITVSAISGPTTEAGGTATFTVVLTSQPTADVTIGLSSSNIAEGTVAPVSLVFAPANWNVPQTVTITGVDDQVADGNTAYSIVTAQAASTDPLYSVINPADVALTNTDNDVAGITVNPTSGLNTSEAVGGTATFTVLLTSQPTANVTIALTSSDTTEGTVLPASLLFTAANWNVAQTVTVTGVNDFVADGPINYTIITAAATSTDASYSGRNVLDVTVINQDNDTAGFTVNPTSGLVTTETGGTATFTVVLNTQPLNNVTIALSSSDTTEVIVSPASLLFTTANWSVAQTVTVTGVDDPVDERPADDGDQPFSIVTGNTVSADPLYSNKVVPDVIGTNQNKDFRPVAVNDSYQTNAKKDQQFNKAAPGVLSNDTDANNDPLTASLVTGPSNGDLALAPDGGFVYTPTSDYTTLQTDSFTYRVSDGKDLSTTLATVSIVLDPEVPTITWNGNFSDGGIYHVGDEFMLLTVKANDNYSISQVRFLRWDAVKMEWVDLGADTNSPYEWNLDTGSLNFLWNQVFVFVSDGAGNTSNQFIWLYRDLPFRLYMPQVAR